MPVFWEVGLLLVLLVGLMGPAGLLAFLVIAMIYLGVLYVASQAKGDD